MTINTNNVKKIFLVAFIFATATAFAQKEEHKKATITGSLDTYYRTNLSTTDKNIGDANNPIIVAPFTSFADEIGFALGMANIITNYESEKVGGVVDIAFGPRGNAATGDYNLNQLYAFWDVNKNTTLTMGRFNTYLGYEVIAPVANFNYSTSYLFSNGPFSHTGLKADFSLSENTSLMLAVMNVTDVNNNLTGVYSVGAQLGFIDQYINFYYDGGETLGFEIDYTGGLNLSNDFFLGFNAAYADNEGNGFYGAALYPQLTTCESFTLGLRGEYFSWMSDGVSNSPSVFAATLTGSYTIDNLIIKPELRLDTHSEEVFPDNDLNATKSLSSLTIVAILTF